MKCELIGLVEEFQQNCGRFKPDKNYLKIIGRASSGIEQGDCYGDFDLPVPESFFKELSKSFQPPKRAQKIKITLETIE